MKSFTNLYTLFITYAQNTSTDVTTLAKQLINDTHRYLLEKFFDNEASYSITTIGKNTVTLTASPAIGDVSATLASVWAFPSVNALVTFSDGEQRTISFTQSSTAITWQGGITGNQYTTTAVIASGATSATMVTPWVSTTGSYVIQFSDGEQKTVTLTNGSVSVSWTGGLSGNVSAYFNTSVITTSLPIPGVQEYRLPSDYSKLKTETMTVGNLKWTPREIFTRQEWDNLTVFPYYADIPQYFFIYNRKLNIYPIPATTGNIISFNYKRRIPDLSIEDVVGTAGVTASVTNGSVNITGSGTTWTPTMNSVSETRWIQFSPTSSSSTSGDNLWYQIQSVNSATSITLMQPYQGTTITSSITYTIGQMPLILEDFQDLLVYRPLVLYFSTIQLDPTKAAQFKALYQEGESRLADYCGQKTVNVNLGRRPIQSNPNLYWFAGNNNP